MPALKTLEERFGKKGLALVGIAAFDSREAVDKKVAEKDLNYLVAFDGEKPASAETYNVRGIPSNWLIDAEGTILERGHGLESIEKRIAGLLGAGTAPAPASGEKKGD